MGKQTLWDLVYALEATRYSVGPGNLGRVRKWVILGHWSNLRKTLCALEEVEYMEVGQDVCLEYLTSSKMGHVGSKTRSPGFEKPCVRSRGHILSETRQNLMISQTKWVIGVKN